MRDLATIQQKILDFRDERDWAQFHDPKNLAEALSIEAGELLVNFLWKNTEQAGHLGEDERRSVRHEIASIFILLTYLCHEFKIDLLREVEIKLAHNEGKYPIEPAKGSSKKHIES
jgi:dCTP diphosphatase